jgi:hypothetical protein
MILHNNLYLVSEEQEYSLVDSLPFLIEQNKSNELVSVLVIHDLLKILKSIYKHEHTAVMASTQPFDTELNHKKASKGEINVKFEPRNFYFKLGRLTYCPNLLSPCHNIVEIGVNEFSF